MARSDASPRKNGPGKSATPATLALQRSGIEFTVHSYAHEPGTTSFGLEAASALGVDASRVFKTLLADVDDHPVVAIVPVDGSLDLKALAIAAGGKKARMLPPEEAQRLTGYVVGGISPIGQRARLRTYLDDSAVAFGSVFVSGGRRGLDVEVAPTDLITITSATVAPIRGR